MKTVLLALWGDSVHLHRWCRVQESCHENVVRIRKWHWQASTRM